MSENIKELVKRLRDESPIRQDGTLQIAQPYQGAIDALEAMAGEVERLKALLSDNSAVLEYAKASQAATEAAEAERDRLNGEVAGLKQSLIIMSDKRCDAVAERDRLKAALQVIASDPTHSGQAMVARKALGGDAS